MMVLITEAFGRQSGSRAVDLGWSACLYVSILAMAVQWGVLPAGLLERFRQRWAFSTGVELRPQPGLPDALPEVVRRSSLCLSIALAATLAVHGLFAGQLREFALVISPTLYFLYLGGVCMALCALIVAGLCVISFLSSQLATARPGARLRAGLASLLGCLAWLAFALALLPVWAPFLILGLGLVASAGLIFLGPTWDLNLIWRAQAGERGPGRVPAARLAWHVACWVAGGVACLALQLLGEQLWGTNPELGLSGSLGLAGAWVGAGLLMLTVYAAGRIHFLRRYRNPGRAYPVRVVLLGQPSARSASLSSSLKAAGFVVEFGEERCSSVSVPLRITGGERVAQERWALEVSPAQLAQPGFREQLKRRSSVRRRRQLLHGMHDLWKRARRLGDPEAEGFWLAPHLWYVPMLSQGTGADEHDDGIAYHPRIPLEARAELRAVLRGAQIDLLFVERGIQGRSLRRVFQALFEYHDLFGGQRPAEERHFVGIPGVRVLIHEHRLGGSSPSAGRVEPDYSSLGSARILHLSHDDGGAQHDRPIPRDFQGVPLSRGGRPLVHA